MSDIDDEVLEDKTKIKHERDGERKRPALHNETLMEIFDFGASALAANRSGLATQSQKQIITDHLKNDADAMWLLLTIMLVGAAVAGIAMTISGVPMLYLVVGAGIMVLPMMAYAYSRQVRARQDLDKLRVRSAAGQARVVWYGQGTHLRARLQVMDKSFDIDLAQGHALEEYDLSQLRVYFTEHGQRLLAAEVIYPDVDKLKMEDIDEDEDDDLLAHTGRQYDEREA